MKKLLLIFAVMLCTSKMFSQQIQDIISPIRLITGQPDSIYVGDLFYMDDYALNFLDSRHIDTRYDKQKNLLFLRTKDSFEGLTLIKFTYKGREYSIPVMATSLKKVKFKFKNEINAQTVHLFGTFNGWNRKSHEMRLNSEGYFETQMALKPGRYEYKFYINGKDELFDPANPEKISNGMGDFNSILNVEENFPWKSYLHILSGNEKSIELNYQTEKSDFTLSKGDFMALAGNSSIPEKNITISNNKISISKRGLPEDIGILRFAVNERGKVSNMQNIFALKKGQFKWNDAVIYSIMIDRFHNGNKGNDSPVEHPELSPKANYMGGDFDGIIQKIEEGYFNKLGVNVLWLSPVYDNTNKAYQEYPAPHRWFSAYHGYWPVNNFDVEEKFGDLKKYEELITKAHQKGIKVLFDFVASFVQIEHPIFKQHPEWFGSFMLPDGRKNLRLWDEYRLTTWFETYLPKFDYTVSQAAIDYMTDNAVWWLKKYKIDGFRHDAVKHVPNVFWQNLTRKIKKEVELPQNRKVYQIGETFGSYELVSSYVNNGQLDAQFNFNLYDTSVPTFSDSTASFVGLDQQLKQGFAFYGVNNLMGNLMDSHDKIRFMAYADQDVKGNMDDLSWVNPPKVDDPRSYKKAQMFMAFLITIPGLPVIYYGDEIGLTGASDPDNRRMMQFAGSLNDSENNMLTEIRKITSLRQEHPALRYGDFQTILVEKDIYAYLRSVADERILVVFNKDKSARKLNLKIPALYSLKDGVSLYSGRKYELNKEELEVELLPLSFEIIKLK